MEEEELLELEDEETQVLAEVIPEETAQEEEVPEDEDYVMENVSRIDRERYYEAARARGDSRKTKLFCVLGAVIMVIGLLTTMYIFLALGLVVALLAIFRPILVCRWDFKKLSYIHPEGSWSKTVRFYSDHVETDSGTGEPTVVPYRAIKREVETQHMYILDFGKKYPATTFCKDGFTVGSLEELKPFLTERQRAAYSKN